jgi:hypothetical protein
MLTLLRCILLSLLLATIAGCGSHDPAWRVKAKLVLLQLDEENADGSHPDDYASISKIYQQGEDLFSKQLTKHAADKLFILTYQKGLLLKHEVRLYHERVKEEALQKEIEERAIKEEELRARLEAERKRQEELLEAQKNLQRKAAAYSDISGGEGSKQVREPTTYTVRRGETLPQIAARPELYNDVALWPLIYRANRDQIRDPYQLWPGQVLKIPRSFSRDEALEARRQAHRRGR